ncbi:hypothetical protein, variant [Exophiala mesophila]|uniref:Major facilitator superfamily (MFS) profile domain-containing protein n=1 Tax=Exophiala mesophila TaxID=212818 RepID=A0A0D2A851_EXOME|nr:hypothetical protein, variant [Exophiala mesophila]KIV95153.1 hypothetical protein, variant [Exophiala mesophila]
MTRVNFEPEGDAVESPPTETQRLLPSTGTSPEGHRSHINSRTLWKIYAIIFFANMGVQILGPAQTRIYETIYCAQWYKNHPLDDSIQHLGQIPEFLCKIKEVQQPVSSLKGWLECFGAIPGLLLSIPMGILVDSIGRKYVGLLVVTTLWLTQVWIAFISWFDGAISLRYIWCGSFVYLFGGGVIVAEIVIACILTDISSKEELTVNFLRTSAFNAFAKTCGPIIAAILMRYDPWLAIYTGLAMLLFTVILIIHVPETLQLREGFEATQRGHATKWFSNITWKETRESLREVMKIWSDWRLCFVALTYPFRMLAYALSDLIQRYVSNRYGWTLADATLLYSIQAAGAGILLFTLLPWISHQIDMRYSWSTIHKNVVLSRASLLVLAIAYVTIGIAFNIPMLIVGLFVESMSTGLQSTMKTLASALVEGEGQGKVFSLLAMVETLSTMLAFPLSASLFNLGLQKGGGAWLGLPYDMTALLAFVCFLSMCLLTFEARMRI